MENEHIRQILTDIEEGKITAGEGYARLKLTPYEVQALQRCTLPPRDQAGRAGGYLRRFQDKGTNRGHCSKLAFALPGKHPDPRA